ncbi:MAG: SurA N-terminal domain-containing protein [Polyangiaceae bacterium]
MARKQLLRSYLVSAALGAAACVLAVAPPTRAAVVERIVAVVGDKAILLSDLRQRAQPFLLQVHQSVPPGAQRNAAISQLYRTVLDRLVDEELEQRAAQQSKLVVTTKEVDEAIARVAAQNKITVEALVAEATKSGINELGYRDELRRQLLEAKLINVRLQGRIRVVDEDLRDAYRKLVMEERQRLGFTPAWITIDVGSSGAEQKERRALAERVAEAARREDFAELARRHSNDASRANGGQLPPMHMNELPPALSRVAMGLEAGQSSAVVRVGDRYVILKVVKRDASELPDFEQARRELSERVYIDKMAQAKKLWLAGLRRQHHVEVRL